MPSNHSILGIDAAWTLAQPSGIALAARSPAGWRLITAEPSYQHFLARSDRSLAVQERPIGSRPVAPALLASAEKLSGRAIDLIAIDMPMAHSPIIGRRCCDNAVSQAYGARKCGTHTPSTERPGRMSDELCEGFRDAGYPLRTTTVTTPGLIEVYPHPALVALACASERLPYKASKVRSYWPALNPAQRRKRLYQQWSEIVALLDCEISGVAEALPRLELRASGVAVKAFEDKLDAIVSAWVGICALEGRAKPFGDPDAAIWIPKPREGVSRCPHRATA